MRIALLIRSFTFHRLILNYEDCEEQHLIREESTRWNSVLSWLMHITLYLTVNNMAFRGTSDKLYTPNNGKFLGLVQLLANYVGAL